MIDSNILYDNETAQVVEALTDAVYERLRGNLWETHLRISSTTRLFFLILKSNTEKFRKYRISSVMLQTEHWLQVMDETQQDIHFGEILIDHPSLIYFFRNLFPGFNVERDADCVITSYPDGKRIWSRQGVIHRIGGPAIIGPGLSIWIQNGVVVESTP